MPDRTPEERAALIQLTAGALAGFGVDVASGKVPAEKAAHKAVQMAEAAVREIEGQKAFTTESEKLVFEKPDR